MSEKQKRDLEATRNALATAAKELMTGCGNCDEVTSRAIAERAGVNQAMINYCYGSREKLLYEVFEQLLAEAQSAEPELTRLMNTAIPAKERLFLLHYAMMKLMIANFNYSRAVTKYVLLNRSADLVRADAGIMACKLRRELGMESLPLVAEHYSGSRTIEECRLIAFELTSMNELAVLRHEELKRSFGLDLTDNETLRDYVRSNVDRFIV